MTYDDFLRNLSKAGLKPSEFAALMQMNRNSLANYSTKGTVPAHLAIIAALIAKLELHEIEYMEVFSGIDVIPKKARGVGFSKKAKPAEKNKKPTNTTVQKKTEQPQVKVESSPAVAPTAQIAKEPTTATTTLSSASTSKSRPGVLYGGAESSQRDRSKISIDDIEF